MALATAQFAPITGQDLDYDIVASPAPNLPPYSLLSVSSPMPSAVSFGALAPDGSTEDNLPVRNGVRLDHNRRVQSATFANCPTSGSVKKSLFASDTTYVFHPFSWYTSITCAGADVSNWLRWGNEDVRAAAAYHMSHQVQTGLENAGTKSESPSLNSAAIFDAALTAQANVRDAVALLLSDYFAANHAGGAPSGGSGPILHVPYIALPQMMFEQIVTVTASGLMGPGGVRISVGPGYDPVAGPPTTTTASTAAWLYLSGPIYTAVGTPFEAADPHGIIRGMIEGRHVPRQNTEAVIVEQRGLYAFDVDNVYARKVVVP